MGVRGKLEAVIYAAEEPVTLQQMAALFGEEALAERALREREAAAGDEAGARGVEVPEPTLFSESELSTSDEDTAAGVAVEPPAEEVPVSDAYQAEGEPVYAGDPDADKRAGRLRDRQAREEVLRVLEALVAEYEGSDRGMEIREVAGGYRVATKPEYHDAVRAFAKSLKPPMKLTLQALETLAVIAYKQPVTSPEVSEIRGVDSGGVLGSLISRKLVTTAGRKPVVGRPILYKTTREFLLRFGLKDLAELPSMEEFEKMAGELQGLGDEVAAQEEAPQSSTEESTETVAEYRSESID